MFSTITRTATGLGVGLLGLALTGCATAPPSGEVPSSTIAAPPESSQTEDAQRQAITRTYKKFWSVSHRLDEMPPEKWRPALEKVATDPVLSRLLDNARAQRAKGVEVYGHVTARITEVRIRGDRATVVDCQDASRSGRADAKTGERKTVGVARNPVTGILTRDADGQWHVEQIKYPGGRC